MLGPLGQGVGASTAGGGEQAPSHAAVPVSRHRRCQHRFQVPLALGTTAHAAADEAAQAACHSTAGRGLKQQLVLSCEEKQRQLNLKTAENDCSFNFTKGPYVQGQLWQCPALQRGTGNVAMAQVCMQQTVGASANKSSAI